MCTCLYIIYMYVYIYTKREREGERERNCLPGYYATTAILLIFTPTRNKWMYLFSFTILLFLKPSQFAGKQWYHIALIWLSLTPKNLNFENVCLVLPILFFVNVLFLCLLLIWDHNESLSALDDFYDSPISQCSPCLKN